MAAYIGVYFHTIKENWSLATNGEWKDKRTARSEGNDTKKKRNNEFAPMNGGGIDFFFLFFFFPLLSPCCSYVAIQNRARLESK